MWLTHADRGDQISLSHLTKSMAQNGKDDPYYTCSVQPQATQTLRKQSESFGVAVKLNAVTDVRHMFSGGRARAAPVVLLATHGAGARACATRKSPCVCRIDVAMCIRPACQRA